MSEKTPTKDVKAPAVVHDSEEDIERRRSKNRVNAKRSRERKRLVLDTLQQDYWKLQQANKRIKGDNEKLREAIKTLKDLKANKTDPKQAASPSVSTSLPAMLGVASPTLQPGAAAAAAAVKASPPSAATSAAPLANPIVELLAQQLLLQETQARMQLGALGLPLHGLPLTQGIPSIQRTVTPELPIDGLLAQGIDPATLARLLQAHGAVAAPAGP